MNYIPTFSEFLLESNQKYAYEVSAQMGKYNSVHFEPSDPDDFIFHDYREAKMFVDSATQKHFDFPLNSDVYVSIDRYELGENGEHHYDKQVYTREIPNVNRQSNKLLDKVVTWFEREYDIRPDSYMGKYYTLDIEDEDDDFLGEIQVRLADHSDNVRNNTKYKGHSPNKSFISIVVADHDPTKNKFIESRYKNEVQLHFTSRDRLSKITKKISDEITRLEQQIISQV